MRNNDFDRAVAAIARRQHGVFHFRQARAEGGTKTMVQARLRSGQYVLLTHRVVAIASHPATWQRQYKAAELSVPGSALADHASALVHGLPGFRVLRPRLVAPRSANSRSSLADVRRSSTIEATTVAGFRVTTLPRTLFDLLGCCPLPVVERAMDDVLAARRVTIADLVTQEETVRASRLPNVATWGALVQERSADGWQPTESELETLLDGVLGRLPDDVEVQRQGTPPWWDAAEHRVDAYLPAWGLIIEADGRRWHTRVADFDRDRWRDNLAAAHGHRVLRFTHTHLTRQPGEALALVVEAGQHAVERRPAAGEGSAA